LEADAAMPWRFAAEPPGYLTERAERDAFTMALAARASDVNALARWAAWLNIWVQAKRALGKKTNPDRKFDHKRMTDAERHLIRLEDRLAEAFHDAAARRGFAVRGDRGREDSSAA
jgi:hypothetical protein